MMRNTKTSMDAFSNIQDLLLDTSGKCLQTHKKKASLEVLIIIIIIIIRIKGRVPGPVGVSPCGVVTGDLL